MTSTVRVNRPRFLDHTPATNPATRLRSRSCPSRTVGGTVNSDPTVDRHVAWMKLRGLSPETIRIRRLSLNLLAAHAGQPIAGLTVAQLDAWQHSLRVSAAARRTYVIQCKGFFKWAAGDGNLRADDPSVVLIRPKVPHGVPRPIGEEDLERAIHAAREPDRCMLTLASYQGLRACELAWLERMDVLERERLLVVRGKGSKERILPLGDTALSALRAHGLPRAGLVFRRPDGRGFEPIGVSNRVNTHLHELGIDVTLHQCRHRFASMALEAVADIRVVQELLGHSSPATTAIYTRVSSARAVEAVAAVAALDTTRRAS